MTAVRTELQSSIPLRGVAATRPRVIAAAVGAALVVNLGIWLLALLAGGDFTMTSEGTAQTVAPGGVAIFTVVPMLVGLTVAALLDHVWTGALRTAQWVGSAIAVATIAGTIAADFDVASTLALGAMHLALIVPLVWALEQMRRRAG